MPPPRDLVQRLQRLRAIFLDDARKEHATGDYWRDDEDLAAYARFLGARIGWKWDAALSECEARGLPRADDKVVLDYGCGAGVAAHRFVAHFGGREVLCHDRSALAMAFAARELRHTFSGLLARALVDASSARPDVLLVSHVVNELDERGLHTLLALAQRCETVVFVESGDRATSRRLSQLRERLLPHFAIAAPCPHRGACPSLARAEDWCHFFANPHPSAFTDGEQVALAKVLGVDQRALPYAFLALTKATLAVEAPPHRVLGRPDVGPHAATVQTCTPDGLQSLAVPKRQQPELYRALKKDPASVRTLPGTGVDGAGRASSPDDDR